MIGTILKILVVAGVVSLAAAQAQAQAQAEAPEDGESLIRSAMCYACHQMDSVSLGPPWRAIAARHAARREVMTGVLVSKVLHGGGGNWGLVPMVPNQHVSEEQARLMVEWVLEQAPLE